MSAFDEISNDITSSIEEKDSWDKLKKKRLYSSLFFFISLWVYYITYTVKIASGSPILIAFLSPVVIGIILRLVSYFLGLIHLPKSKSYKYRSNFYFTYMMIIVGVIMSLGSISLLFLKDI